MHPIQIILGCPVGFLDDLFNQIEHHGLDVSKFYMDHICYRVASLEDYDSLKSKLLEHGQLLSDKIIGGRPISVIQLYEVYHYNGRYINVVELPAPKSGSDYNKGYEHVEFVTPMPLDQFISNHSSIAFDLKGMTKRVNRDVRLQLNGCSAKFHEHSLKYVIEVLEE